jgi:hypothetical protein
MTLVGRLDRRAAPRGGWHRCASFVSAASQQALAAEQEVMLMRLNVAVSNQLSSICFLNVSQDM